MAVHDDTIHAKISAPHIKCTAFQYTEGSMQFGTQLWCIILWANC